jgi:hypothetical protein
VVEQVAKADPPSCAESAGEELADAVVQPELALGDELHDDRCHEALRDASDPEPVRRASASASDLGVSRGDDGPLPVLLDERDHGGYVTGRDEPIGGELKLGLGR